MLVTYKQCDLCKGRIERFSNELHIKYKAKRKIFKYFSTLGYGDGIPIATNWEEIDVCEECLKEIVSKRYKNEVNS